MKFTPQRSTRTVLMSAAVVLLQMTPVLSGGPGPVVSPSSAQHPNIVILYADDMGYGDLACQNPESKIPTPALDQLASEGTRFTDAHSSSGICTPSRYALLHGRYHWRKFHGIVQAFGQPVMDEEKTTIAEMLRSAGYRTGCIGKWHLGWDWQSIRSADAVSTRKEGYSPESFDWSRPIPGGPLSHGFDSYFGDDVPNFPPYTWFRNDQVILVPTIPRVTPKPTAEGNWEARPGPSVEDWDYWAVMPKLTEQAEAWIAEQSADRPFFLYFPFTSPHAPIVPTDEFVGSSDANGYGDFMVQTDATVGRVLRALDQYGFTQNTLVIFTSDNGPERYAYERVRKFGHRSMGPFRGLKRDIYEGGHRVPFVVRWPGKVPAATVSDGLLSQIDIAATLAAVVDAELPEGSAEDSVDQSGLWTGTAPSARDVLVHNTREGDYAVRKDKWVLIDAPTGTISKVPDWYNQEFGYSSARGAGELYDLESDPGQHQNLIERFPDMAEELREVLNSVRNRTQVQ